MKTFDVSAMIVVYNFVIGVLLMLSSEKLGKIAGHISKLYEGRVNRYARISVLTFGSTVAVLSAAIFISFHWLRLGV